MNAAFEDDFEFNQKLLFEHFKKSGYRIPLGTKNNPDEYLTPLAPGSAEVVYSSEIKKGMCMIARPGAGKTTMAIWLCFVMWSLMRKPVMFVSKKPLRIQKINNPNRDVLGLRAIKLPIKEVYLSANDFEDQIMTDWVVVSLERIPHWINVIVVSAPFDKKAEADNRRKLIWLQKFLNAVETIPNAMHVPGAEIVFDDIALYGSGIFEEIWNLHHTRQKTNGRPVEF